MYKLMNGEGMYMNNISVLVVDDNKEIVETLTMCINAASDMTLAGVAYNGQSAYQMILKTKPDVVILDLIMPVLDGYGLLRKLQDISLDKQPKIILYSMFANKIREILKKQTGNMIDYCLLKPQSSEHICDVITMVTSTAKISNRSEDLEVAASNMLQKVGVPPHVKGYRFLRDSIIWMANDNEIINAVTKELYPGIAKRYNTTASRAERAMRHAIAMAWQRGNDGIREYFEQCKPTNAEFIATLCEQVKQIIRRL